MVKAGNLADFLRKPGGIFPENPEQGPVAVGAVAERLQICFFQKQGKKGKGVFQDQLPVFVTVLEAGFDTQIVGTVRQGHGEKIGETSVDFKGNDV